MYVKYSILNYGCKYQNKMTGIQISDQMNYQKTALAKFTFNILNVKYYLLF